MADLPTLRARVEAAQNLAAKATPGPWERTGSLFGYTMVRPTSGRAAICGSPTGGSYDHAANADLLAAAPDLVTLATDLLAEVDRARLSASCAGFDLTAIGAACDIRDNEYPLQAVRRVVDQLDAIRAALGNGADEAAWPPGLTVAEAVGRLREERRSVPPLVPWPPVCNAVVSERPKLSGFMVRTLCPLPAGHEGPHAEALGAGDGGGDGGGR